jgi:hypothetical protein
MDFNGLIASFSKVMIDSSGMTFRSSLAGSGSTGNQSLVSSVAGGGGIAVALSKSASFS